MRADTAPAAALPAAALFLDRDGVINFDRGYVHRSEDFEFLPGIFELCSAARAQGLRLVVVTNQAGIGRGLYDERDFERLTVWMRERFAEAGAPIDAVYHCPTHPTAGIGPYRAESPRRKPNPGMILDARDELGLDLAASILLGDKPSDVQAGLAAGVGLNLLLVAEESAAAPAGIELVHDLTQARRRIESHLAGRPRVAGGGAAGTAAGTGAAA
jgi:D-glycero-D-manno-heptose 1,7-bisphosphate phosphatase